jgi:hypothetical protein
MKEAGKFTCVKANGKCCFCDTQLKISKEGHVLLRTKGYTKVFDSPKTYEVKCPKCKASQIVVLN